MLRLKSRTTSFAAVVTIGLAAVVTAAPSASAQAKMTHSQAASKFRANGVGWTSSGNCSNRNNKTCTSFGGIRSATVNGAITLKRSSGCAITITGGTETGHAGGTYSHGNGYKLDMATSNCLNGYITRNFPRSGTRGDGSPVYRSGSGNEYAREGNHWDITYYNCGGC